MKYVGLTDDPARRLEEHNNPRDWKQRTFTTEEEARKWAKELLELPEYETGAGDRGLEIRIHLHGQALDPRIRPSTLIA